ncbi:sigma-54-dependent Fis family transcriptional regulator [Ectobacillus ponti]|uniref:Sigma-54-dependent Fis family transcriptional regulator n=1 Tax=Ectobacillus ponti TaxID=2961894 RepID=A0AA41X1T4_9BACI|nr:sigma-54-dependent Fis family transcriptional regulator [Ectobacillus ponti]MCP8967394.1 sigma-54-dependent Fis family transcriptional regulator [Ectobacillus ponti]
MIETVNYFDTWKRFVTEGILDASRLSKRILESWYRCKNQDVNPNLHKATHIVSDEVLAAKQAESALFLEAASPHLHRMQGMIEEQGMMALLVDPDGYVLSLTGDRRVLQDAGKINFTKGVRWTEEEVGTNAIGTALQVGEAVMISGTEHYSVASHSWSCSAAPIHHDDGRLLGVIDVSCPLERTHPFMLGMTASVACAIERELRIRVREQELELIRQGMELLYGKQPVVICNIEQTIVAASKSVNSRIRDCIGIKVRDLVQYGFVVQAEAPVYSPQHQQIGISLFLAEAPSIRTNVYMPAVSPAKICFPGETGVSGAFQRVLHDIQRVAPADASVHISGETGTGKEVVARAIHDNSLCKDGPFVAINCGAIPKELMESELFGYVEGAFTGAKRKGYKGKLEQANGGTLFLDEIGEVPPAMQVALLRVLQERQVVPLGGTKEIPLHIRIITATHRNLTELVRAGTFRQDLYYRLHVYPLHVPALRERREDIPYLVHHFCKMQGWEVVWPDVYMERFMQHDWPGNIRELFNVLERIHIIAPDAAAVAAGEEDILRLLEEHTAGACSQQKWDSAAQALNPREQIQRDMILEALQKAKGNVSMAAKLLDIPRSTFYRRLQKLGL